MNRAPRRSAPRAACAVPRVQRPGLLLILVQVPFPALRRIELRRQAVQADATSAPRKTRWCRTSLALMGRPAPRAACRAENKACAACTGFLSTAGVRDGSRAPGPQPRQGAKQQRFSGSGLAHDQHTFCAILSARAFPAAGCRRSAKRSRRSSMANSSRLPGLGNDAAFDIMHDVGVDHGAAEAGNAQQGRAPVGNGAEIVDEPAQRGLHLHEGAGGQHQTAEGEISREIKRRRDQNRGDQA